MSDGSSTWQFTYDADGLRTKKTNGSTTYEYVYNGGQLVYVKSGSDTLRIVYDGSSPFRLDYNGTAYHYVTNLQGDVIALLDDMGEKVVEYTYDAWGNLLSITGEEASTVGIANPLRYRGYCYDVETGLYYLQSRYYDPKMGRFINADTTDILGVPGDFYDKNLFAYCDNNPVMRKDVTGHAWETIRILKTSSKINEGADNAIDTYRRLKS